jgi:DNA-binding SARP family transcriptional activator
MERRLSDAGRRCYNPVVTEFRILGPLEVVDETGPVPVTGPKQRALLALLLIHAGETLSTDRIVDELWGETPPRTATTSLWNLIAQLRKVLPPDLLATKPPGYVLRLEGHALDLRHFEELVARARTAGAEERSDLLRQGLALWRGGPLADLAYEPFARREIERLEELRLGVLEDRIDADLERGAHTELAGELDALVTDYPLRERIRGQLMLALYRSGRQAEALQAYLEARRTLVDELGIEPRRELQDLYRAILRQETKLDEHTSPAQVDDDHLADVARAALASRLVIVLGADVDQARAGERQELPSSGEIVAHLAHAFSCPPDHVRDLAHVAEYVALTRGIGPLYDELHQLFDRDSTPGPIHKALAKLDRSVAERSASHQLIVTTSFHELLEQAFREDGCDFDVVSYLAVGRHQGKFLHATPDGASIVVDAPYAYTDVSPERRSVILKIHGGIDRGPGREWESFVVSEDDHIDHLAHGDITMALPVTLAARLRRSHFLFLGYPLQEWSLRVFLHRVWGREKVAYRSWAIAPALDGIDKELWRQRGIDIFDAPLDEYVAGLARRLEAEARV